MASLEQLSTALVNADKSGDTQAARILAAEIQKMRAGSALPAPTAERQPIYEDAPDMTGVAGIMNAPTNGENISPSQLGQRIMRGADDTVRMVARGATFGMADRLAAKADEWTGRGENYSDNLKAQVAQTEAARTRMGAAGTAAELAGGIMTGAGLAKGGLTLAGRMGSGLLSRSLGFGAEGAAYGAAQGAGTSYDTTDGKMKEALKGAILGGAIGGGLPIAGKAASGLYNIGSRLLAPVAGLGRTNTAMLGTTVSRTPEAFQSLKAMGPDASLADAAPALAQGVATARNVQGSRLVDMLRAREARTGERLAAATESALGQRVSPMAVEGEISAAQKALGPQYDAALANSRAVDTSQLARKLEALAINSRGPAQKAAREVREFLDIPGSPGVLDPSPNALLKIRKATDGLFGSAKQAGNRDVLGVLGNARQAIDDELAAKVPGIKAVDAQFAELAAQRDAFKSGQEIFDTARSAFQRPDEVASSLSLASLPKSVGIGPSAAPVRMRQGARAEIDRLVSTGTDDLRSLEKTFQKQANADKLGMMFGDDRKQQFMDAIIGNRKMRDTFNLVDRGSQTAQRTAASEAVKAERFNIPSVTEMPTAIVNALLNKAVGRTSAKNVETLDKALSLQGNARDQLVEALLSSEAQRAKMAERISRFFVNPALLAPRVFGGVHANQQQRR